MILLETKKALDFVVYKDKPVEYHIICSLTSSLDYGTMDLHKLTWTITPVDNGYKYHVSAEYHTTVTYTSPQVHSDGTCQYTVGHYETRIGYCPISEFSPFSFSFILPKQLDKDQLYLPMITVATNIYKCLQSEEVISSQEVLKDIIDLIS